MNVFQRVKEWLTMRFWNKAKEEFKVEALSYPKTEEFINRCIDAYKGNPYWLNDTGVTVNFAKSISSEVARLATLGIHIEVDGKNARSEYIQKQIDKMFYNLRHWVEYGCAGGTVILKPTGDSVEMLTVSDFTVTEERDGQIVGVVFHDQIKSADGKKWYNRLEYHRFLENGNYSVSNRTFVGDTPNDEGKAIAIEETPWRGVTEDVEIENIERPLFGVLRMPSANNIEFDAPLALPIFADAMEELKALDIAYARNINEIYDSERIVLMDSDKLIVTKGTVEAQQANWGRTRDTMKLPRFVRNTLGDGANTFYQEINPSLNTPVRIEGISNLLSQISYKCGFSNGYFSFNERTGIATATQVEAEQQRTIQLIKDVRDKLEDAIKGVVYAIDKFADLYDLAPVGECELVFDFGDITYNYEEEKATWWNYVLQGKIPAWKFFEKFEGMTEEDAKAIIAEAQSAQMEQAQMAQGLFSNEE